MSYADGLLSTGERITYRAKQHPFIWLWGARFTILAIIGAVVLTLVSERVWEINPNLYQVIFGGLIVLVVLFMPGGLISLLQKWGILPRSRRL